MEFIAVLIILLPAIILSVIIYKGIIKPEIDSLFRVIHTLDFIEANRHLYTRIGDILVQFDKKNITVETLRKTWDEKMLSVENKRVFVSYSKGMYGSTSMKHVVERAESIINSFEKGKQN